MTHFCKACDAEITNNDINTTEQKIFCERCLTIICNYIRSQIIIGKEYGGKLKTNREYIQKFK